MFKGICISLCMIGFSLPIAAQNNDLPEGPGKAVVVKMCSGCHKMTTVTSKHATKDQWASIVDRMVSRGANGTDEEIDIVVNYLATNFPPEKEKTTPPSITASAAWLNISSQQMEAMLNHHSGK
jgi:mono/diheme cytochrome c family protein